MESATGHWRTGVRIYECDALGHVNNALYVAYLMQATAEAWPQWAPVRWDLRRLAVEYLAPAVVGDELEIVAWPSGIEGGRPVCGYQVRRLASGTTLARALAVWSLADRRTGDAVPIANSWPAGIAEGCTVPRALRLPHDVLGARTFRWQHAVRHYELDAGGQASPVAILHWLEEAKYIACAEVGWPLQRLVEAGCITVQVRHDSEFLAGLCYGDEIQVRSRIYELGRVKGMWRHDVIRSGELVAVDYSSGAFLDRQGRPNPPPRAMLDALVAGPPHGVIV